jgi:hypothetical protein
VPPDERETEELRRRQALRVTEEQTMADEAFDEDERAVHERRSDKAAYLEQKLEEQQHAPDAPDAPADPDEPADPDAPDAPADDADG